MVRIARGEPNPRPSLTSPQPLATRQGNIARFINHSCEPNLYVEKWWVNRVPRLGLFAKRPIAEGEEVSYNYSVKWFGDARAAQRCFCGAASCTGYLGPAPRK